MQILEEDAAQVCDYAESTAKNCHAHTS